MKEGLKERPNSIVTVEYPKSARFQERRKEGLFEEEE